MGRVYDFDSLKNEYPSRKDYINKDGPLPKVGELYMFHPIDVVESRAPNKVVYGTETRKYTIIVLGVNTLGEKVEVIIDGIPIYFDVRMNSDSTIYEVNSIIKEFFLGTEIIYKYPGINFREEKQKYLRIFFPNVFNRQKALDRVIEAQIETATDMRTSQWLNHVMVENELTVSDWVAVRPHDVDSSDEDECLGTKHIIFTKLDDYIPVNRPLSKVQNIDLTTKPPIYFKLAWDIEVYSSTSEFPRAENIKDDIFMIGGAIYISTQDEPILPFCICHKPISYSEEEPPDWDLIRCKDEREVIGGFFEILKRFHPEFRMAFNNYGFDNPFVITRAGQPHMKLLREYVQDISPLPLDYYRMSRKVSDLHCIVSMERIKMEGAFDSNAEKFVIRIPGTIDLDMMVYLKRTTYKKEDTLGGHALRSYLQRYGLPNKLDISFADMQEAYRREDGDVMREVAEYCVVDALSCERLQQKTGSIMGLMSLAHLSMTSIYSCMVRAGGGRIQNALYCQGYRNDVIYTDHPKDKPTYDGKYPGAIVFNPVKGRYLDSPIMALDYQSLYPSIMRALWMSSETFTDEETAISLRDRGYDVFSFTYPLASGGEDRDVTVYFVREGPDGHKVRGVFPQCLELLMDLRVYYKGQMKRAPNLVEKQLFDEKQKATKVLMNTAYGKIGSPLFALYNVFISSAITMYGRRVLTLAKEVAEEKGYELIYGDSVTGDMKVSIAYDNPKEGSPSLIRYIPVKDVIGKGLWHRRTDGKEYYTPPAHIPMFIKEHNRYVRILNVIRHKTNKKIYRVRDEAGYVDVTEDHSLVLDDEARTPITPEQLHTVASPRRRGRVLGAVGRVTANMIARKYKDYVYDFSTESELFNAGTTGIILHNTDSIFIKASDATYTDCQSAAERVAKAQALALPVAKEINRRNRLLLGDKDNFDKIVMNLDKFLHPATFCAKKKYLGRDWDIVDLSDPKHPTQGELYISGLEVTKRGKTELLKDVSYKVIDKLNDFEYRGGVVEAVEGILDIAVEDISCKPRTYFFKKQKYTEGKGGSMAQFIERMKIKNKENPSIYNLPASGEYVEVAIVKVLDYMKADGCLRKDKVSDRMEFRNVIEHFDLQVDIKYYLEDILGTLARFINSDSRFDPTANIEKDGTPVSLTLDEIDKKSQANAEKYLKKRLDELTGDGASLTHQQVKKLRRALHVQYAKYGGFVQTLMDAYNDNVGNNIDKYILVKARTCSEERMANSTLSEEEIMEKVYISESYIQERAEAIKVLYNIYKEHLRGTSKGNVVEDTGSNQGLLEPEDYINIQKHINALRRYYSMKSMDNIEIALIKVFG